MLTHLFCCAQKQGRVSRAALQTCRAKTAARPRVTQSAVAVCAPNRWRCGGDVMQLVCVSLEACQGLSLSLTWHNRGVHATGSRVPSTQQRPCYKKGAAAALGCKLGATRVELAVGGAALGYASGCYGDACTLRVWEAGGALGAVGGRARGGDAMTRGARRGRRGAARGRAIDARRGMGMVTVARRRSGAVTARAS